ncbi:LysE family translocator [Wenzhouxiangella marina]|uniref:Lysine exporter protein (LYSE/YGGA) n=1 Tax=Wenzhouxiangella marina TaxID=1579979 RepID=A0A0K0XU42_9GAMM|nr:LysE family translocator [Wenzhouxiangella marina]AKS41151.1 Lysine exporter protein (LYSE/YGGA) [Wenzhouxiangella marina]MBB6088030.1 threonine/homoserine/homoserine lactone efflux protein [Wenzhouxiangella marina]
MAEAVLALISATALLLGSPGPAPLALAGTSAAFGVRRGLPFLFGILVGLSVAILGASLGLAALFQAYPPARQIVQGLGAAYIAYVAFKIATAPVVQGDDGRENAAPRFIDGFILNLLNPKAYAAFLALFSQFLLPLAEPGTAFLATAIVCLLVATVVDVAWLLLGGIIGPLLKRPRSARMLRVLFAVLMVAALLWAILQ